MPLLNVILALAPCLNPAHDQFIFTCFTWFEHGDLKTHCLKILLRSIYWRSGEHGGGVMYCHILHVGWGDFSTPPYAVKL